jgi:hypothetical protein
MVFFRQVPSRLRGPSSRPPPCKRAQVFDDWIKVARPALSFSHRTPISPKTIGLRARGSLRSACATQRGGSRLTDVLSKRGDDRVVRGVRAQSGVHFSAESLAGLAELTVRAPASAFWRCALSSPTTFPAGGQQHFEETVRWRSLGRFRATGRLD